ncbi:MAG: hypothetical protein K0Q95_2798 [Bacteroidota bacterium]|jgi:outer membrane protein OmpA-like peptidoglycan-associated protein|nr:hypothetical protein [Bacteroidota bacterium]
MKKLYIPLVLLTALSLSLSAQEKSRKEREGDKYAFRYSFDKAIESYTHAKNLSPDGQRRLAESYSKMDQNKEAEIVYAKLIGSGIGLIAEDYYNYAMVMKANAKYDEANKTMDKFSEQKPDDLRAKSYAGSKASFADLLKDNGSFKVETLKVNTAAQDFGTSFYKDQIVFASTRSAAKMVKRSYNWNGMPFLNMFVADKDGTQLKDPKRFDNSLNGKMHDGPGSFSRDATFMAYTKNHFKDKSKDKVVELQICFSTFRDGKWSEEEPFNYNNNEYSVGQPFLTEDGNTMYFTSDMPGGYGGSDLYKTSRMPGSAWNKPENLGNSINTEGDEMFPFVESEKGVLYFSSNGLSGLGGTDIFTSVITNGGYGLPKNSGSPLNTQYDDFACIVDSKTHKGYFSSNRSGGSGADDIYGVEVLKVADIQKRIEGFARDRNLKVLGGVSITLLDESNKVLDTITTNADGSFSFKVASNTNYLLTGKKKKFNDGNNVANTNGNEAVVKADVILLTKAEAIASEIKEGKDLAELLALNTIFFDYGKSDIRKDAEPDLDKIIEIMNAYPEMIVEFRSYTDCRSTKEFNQLLSERRAKASSEYVRQKISNPSRIHGKGYGEPKLASLCPCEGPVLSECLEGEHQKNRKTEFIIVKK